MASYYSTKEWKELRDAAVKRDGHTCQRCGSKNKLTAHHKVPRTDGGADHLDNLKTVCKSCHIKEHIDIARAARGGSGMGKYAPTNEELAEMGLEW